MSTPPVIERFSTGWVDYEITRDLFVGETENYYICANGQRASKEAYCIYYTTYAEARQAIITRATEALEAGRAFVARRTESLARANAIPAEQPASLNTSSN